MQFNSFVFIFAFLPGALAGYLVLRKTRFANAFMLAASIYFYAQGALWYLAPLFFTALLDFFIGQKIEVLSNGAGQRILNGNDGGGRGPIRQRSKDVGGERTGDNHGVGDEIHCCFMAEGAGFALYGNLHSSG